MTGQLPGVSSNKFSFYSIAKSFSYPLSNEDTQISSEEASPQSNTSQKPLIAQSNKPSLHLEIWILIAERLSTMDDFRNFSLVNTTHFRICCSILFKTFKPENNKEAQKLFKLPYNRAFDHKDVNYANQRNRLIREMLFNRGRLKPLRGNLMAIANMLFSGNKLRTLKDLEKIGLLNSLEIETVDLSTLPGVIDQNGTLSPEHASSIFNNLSILLRQEATPNIVAFLRIPPNKVNREIFEIFNNVIINIDGELTVDTPIDEVTRKQIIGDIFLSKTRLDAVDEAGLPLFKYHLLYWAAADDDMDRVKELLNDGVSINVRSRAGGSALHGAILEGHVEMIKFLIEQGINLDIVDMYGDTPFLAAAQHQSPEILKLLLDTCDAVAEKAEKVAANSITLLQQRNSADDSYALQLAVRHQKLDNVKYLVERAANIESGNIRAFQQISKGLALYDAVTYSAVEIAAYLLEHNAVANQEWRGDEERPCTLLHIAVRNGSVDMLKLLLANRTEELFDKHKIDLLHLATACGDPSVLEFIVDKSEDVFDNLKEELLNTAISELCFDTAKYLLELPGKPIKLNDGGTWVPLLQAIDAEGEAQDRYNMVRLLLKHGAKTNVFSGRWSPLNRAIYNNYPDIVELLVGCGADIYAAPIHLPTLQYQLAPMIMAIANELPEVFNTLIESQHFDTSHSDANLELLKLVASREQRLALNSSMMGYSIDYPRVNSLLTRLDGGAEAVLATAHERGRRDVVNIFLQTQDADFIYSQEILNQPQVSGDFANEQTFQSDSDSELSVSELDSSDERLLADENSF